MDCGIATLAMYTGKTYEEAMAELVKVRPDAFKNGCYLKDLAIAAWGLNKFDSVILRQYDTLKYEGILSVRGRREGYKSEFWHFAYLYYDSVVDPNYGRLYTFKEYTARFRACSLLTTTALATI